MVAPHLCWSEAQSWCDNHVVPPRSGDRSPGFFNEPSRCWEVVYDHNLQSTHCAEAPTYRDALALTSRRRAIWRVWACSEHLAGLAAVREFGRRR